MFLIISRNHDSNRLHCTSRSSECHSLLSKKIFYLHSLFELRFNVTINNPSVKLWQCLAMTVWTHALYCAHHCIITPQAPWLVVKYTHSSLTLKMPRKPASENVICLCCLLNILANFSNLFLHTGKQCGPWSDCSWRSSLIWVHTVCKNDF